MPGATRQDNAWITSSSFRLVQNFCAIFDGLEPLPRHASESGGGWCKEEVCLGAQQCPPAGKQQYVPRTSAIAKGRLRGRSLGPRRAFIADHGRMHSCGFTFASFYVTGSVAHTEIKSAGASRPESVETKQKNAPHDGGNVRQKTDDQWGIRRPRLTNQAA